MAGETKTRGGGGILVPASDRPDLVPPYSEQPWTDVIAFGDRMREPFL